MSAPRILLWKNKIWEASGSNLGDLAIITATVDALRREIPGAQIVMLSDDPAHTESLYEGVTAERFSFGAYVRAIRDADLVVLGGGTLFTDATSMAVLVNTSAAFIAKLYGTPVALYGVASGFMRATSRMLVRGALKRTSLACLRDPESVAELTPLAPASLEARIHRRRRVLAARPRARARARQPRRHRPAPRLPLRQHASCRSRCASGSACCPPATTRSSTPSSRSSPKSPTTSSTPTAARSSSCPMYSAIGPAEGTSGYLKKEFSSRDDQVCREIHERMTRKDSARVFISDRPREVLSLIASSRMLMGVPLHSLILAHVAETPFVGLAYQGKVARFMRDAGLEALHHPRRLDGLPARA